jgi:NADH-quinone oxidoreductase subunit M
MPWLSLVVFLPLVGVPVLMLLPWVSATTSRLIALGVMIADLIVAFGVLGAFDPAKSGYQLVEQVTWVKSAGLSYLVGVDGFSIWMVVLTAFMFPVALIASWKVESRVPLFLGLMLALAGLYLLPTPDLAPAEETADAPGE